MLYLGFEFLVRTVHPLALKSAVTAITERYEIVHGVRVVRVLEAPSGLDVMDMDVVCGTARLARVFVTIECLGSHRWPGVPIIVLDIVGPLGLYRVLLYRVESCCTECLVPTSEPIFVLTSTKFTSFFHFGYARCLL